MTGSQLLDYVLRRLAEKGLSLPAERTAELYDLITEGRDAVKLRLAVAGSPATKTLVALERVGSSQVYKFPDATRDPLQVIELRNAGTNEPLEPAVSLNVDAGHYRWNSFRQVQLADDLSVTGLEVDAVLADADIDATTTEANIGLPTPCHRAIGKYAAWKAVTVDEESDGAGMEKDYETAVGRLESIYGEFDHASGLSLRHGLMNTIGRGFGDMISE